MDALMTFVPAESKEAEIIAERIIIHLQHGNSAVILITIKVLLYLMNYMENRKLVEHICKKMGPPLGTSL
jgi:AP-2 complex subunit beta-1